MRSSNFELYAHAEPYFGLVRRALGDLVDGEHYFDIVADDIVYEVLYDVAGWPRVIRGRADLMAQFGGYCDNVALQSADKLFTHKTDDGDTVVITCPIMQPKIVRYSWADNPDGNLYNNAGLPAIPFRTDEPATQPAAK